MDESGHQGETSAKANNSIKGWQPLFIAIISGMATVIAAYVAIIAGTESARYAPGIPSTNPVIIEPVPSAKWPVSQAVTVFATAPAYSGRDCDDCQVGSLTGGTYPVICKYLGRTITGVEGHNYWWLLIDRIGTNDVWASAYYLKNYGNDTAKYDNGLDIPVCAD